MELLAQPFVVLLLIEHHVGHQVVADVHRLERLLQGKVVFQGVGEPGIGLPDGLHVAGVNHLQLIVAHEEPDLLARANVVGGIVVHNAVVIQGDNGLHQSLTAHLSGNGSREECLLLLAFLAVEGIDLGEVLVHAVGDTFAGSLVKLDVKLEICFQALVQPWLAHFEAVGVKTLAAEEQRRGDEADGQYQQRKDDEIMVFLILHVLVLMR